jgi:hypothetical protein
MPAIIASVAEHSQANSCTPSKKRKSEKNSESARVKKGRASWTADLVESVIHLRYSEIAEKKWKNCRNNFEKAEWWKWFTNYVNERNFVQLESDQVQNRWKQLKTEWNVICAKRTATGNCQKVELPPYYEVMNQFFQVKSKCTLINETEIEPSKTGKKWNENGSNS